MRLEQSSYHLNAFCPNRLPLPGPLPKRATATSVQGFVCTPWCVWVAGSLSPNWGRRRQKRNPPCCSSDPLVPSQPASVSLLPELSYGRLLGDVGVVRSPLGVEGQQRKGFYSVFGSARLGSLQEGSLLEAGGLVRATHGRSPVCRAHLHWIHSDVRPQPKPRMYFLLILFSICLPVFKIRMLGVKGKWNIFHQIEGHFYLFPHQEIQKPSQNVMLTLIRQQLMSSPCLLVSGAKYIYINSSNCLR